VGALEYIPEPPCLGLFGECGGGAGALSRMETDDGDGDADGGDGDGDGGDGDGDGDGGGDGDGDGGDGDVSGELIDFHEWVGAVSCGCVGEVLREETKGGSKQQQQQQQQQKAAKPDDGGGAVEAHRWEGLLLPSHAGSALDFCRDAVDAGRVPWAALTLWGFADDPTPRSPSGGGGGGGRGKSGKIGQGGGGGRGGPDGGGDDLTFLVLPGDRYVMFSQPL
jgi:hypothetical protein